MSRKPKDLTLYRGHHVVNGTQLREQFAEDPDDLGEGPRMWRRIRHGAAIVALVVIVVFGAGVAWAILSGYLRLPEPAAKPGPPACPTGTYDYLPTDQVSVTVLNAAAREGLAKVVADRLAERKFAIKDVGNERYSTEATAVVRGGPAGEAAAFTLQRNVPGSIYVRDERTDASVDLILAPAFKDLTDPAVVDQTPGPITCDVPTSPATPPVR
jgi:hypothetical protein